MATIQSNQRTDAIQQAHEQFSNTLRRQSEQIDQLRQVIESLQNDQQQLEEVASHMLEPLTRSLAADAATSAVSPSGILASVLKITAATDPEQIFEALAKEAGRMGVRAVVLSIRGCAAWGTSAAGFAPDLSEKALKMLVVPLNQDGPFRQVFEMKAAVETKAIDLMRNPNVLVKFAPDANARMVLLPVCSAGSVAAILYAETGERRDPGLIDSLKLLAEFAGAQIDRLTVIHGGLGAVELAPATEDESGSKQAGECQIQAAEPGAAAKAETPKVITTGTVSAETPAPVLEPVMAQGTVSGEQLARASEVMPVLTASTEAPQLAKEHQATAEASSITLSAEEEEKIHRDARRFSKLLVSEIELYNKSSVEEGRKNKDLYQRLKKDIDRSRETYEKRFAHTVASKIDYFHEELVRTLAENDLTLLGPAYPGPSV